MKLQTKLLAGFATVAAITLIASAIGYWQTQKLASALYEVGVVRLASMQALDRLFEAKTALDASKRELMRAPTLQQVADEMRARSSGSAATSHTQPRPPELQAEEIVGGTQNWSDVLDEELRRQRRAWDRADQGWKTYAAAPKTSAEAEKWQALVATWTSWRESYTKAMSLLVQARDTSDTAYLLAAHRENQDRLFASARDSRTLLMELVALNDRIASDVKVASIASRHDAELMQRFMLGSVVLSVLAALGGGILLSRLIHDSLRPMSAAFSRIAGGDLDARVPVASQDEIGQMAAAMNAMVDSLRASEAARQRVTDHLAEIADRLEFALRTSRLGVWRRNLRTGAAEWDARMFELFGLPAASAGPDRAAILALIVPEDRESARAYWSQPYEPGRIYQYRFSITRPDGRRRQLETHGRLQEIAGQPSDWTLGVVGDVTDIAESAAESARLREQLEQAHRLQSLGAQAAAIAHDFNNLLTGINGFLDLAAGSLPAHHEASSLVQQARHGAQSAHSLVTRLLQHARDSHGIHRRRLDLGRVAQETIAFLSTSLPQHVTLRLEIPPALPSVMADPGGIQRVLLNLCTNAIHAIGPHPGEISLRIAECVLTEPLKGRPDCPVGSYVRLSVQDNGHGMDEATLQRIFAPFFTTKSAEEGTGLGLAIVSEIIAEHSGGLTVESRSGHGTTFHAYLPADPAGRARSRALAETVTVI